MKQSRGVSKEDQSKLIPEPGNQEQRLLVAVSPSQISEQLVRWAHRLSLALNCWWGAVYVETSASLSEADQWQLSRTLALARSLGAEVITTTDSDLVQGLLLTALQRGVTQIIIGKRAGPSYRRLFRTDRWLERLLQESGELDIHVVRFKEGPMAKASPIQGMGTRTALREYLLAVGLILAVAWIGQHVNPLVGYRAVAWIFLSAIVVIATFVSRGATLLAAAMSALLWDFLFEPPIYSFSIDSAEDRILFVLYVVIAATLGQMVSRIRAHEKTERERQERATALQLLTREVTAATSLDEMLKKAAEQTAEVFKADIAMLLPGPEGRLSPHGASAWEIPEQEHAVAAWVFEQGQAAGKFTSIFSTTPSLYVPLAFHGDTLGVMGLRLRQEFPPTVHQRNLLDAFSQQIAAVIQRRQMQEISEKSKLLAESERLSKTVLDSISHEIRTPLAVIQTATTNMYELGGPDLSTIQKAMVLEIQEASERLNRLVGKVLDMTRLESGHIKPNFNLSEVSELVLMAEGETRKELAHHKVTMDIAPDLPLIRIDFELMLHALTNLLSNAAFHTPAGTEVWLSAKVEDGAMLFIVADSGPGIPPASIPHLFEKFYRAPNARTGGTGLGLSLVKGFIEAHSGQVKVENRATGGTAFTIRLPL
jgi:two-component system, OmpR family, sensor histidine kinase KdpD